MPLVQTESVAHPSIHVRKTDCAHSRIIEDLVTPKGEKTGQIICVECLAVFPDPAYVPTMR
ncbi:hypothetical protein YTPLAS18_19320 [Nitrospira sp.]|nr:hypothetical protein YTPLAS18_19320 [Nitrospira sp.]